MIDKNDIDIEALLREQDLYDNPLTEKQADILRAAEKLFVELGFAETATAAIAKEAKVTEKTLFKHFPTKSHLLKRVLFPILLKTMLPMQLRKIRSLMHENFESYQKFFEVFSLERWKTVRENGPQLKFMITELLMNDKMRTQVLSLWKQNIWEDIVERIKLHQTSGEIRSDVPPETIAQMQIMLIAGHAFLYGILAKDQEFNAEERAKVIARLFSEGIGRKDS